MLCTKNETVISNIIVNNNKFFFFSLIKILAFKVGTIKFSKKKQHLKTGIQIDVYTNMETVKICVVCYCYLKGAFTTKMCEDVARDIFVKIQ